jgi:hypothetical protein
LLSEVVNFRLLTVALALVWLLWSDSWLVAALEVLLLEYVDADDEGFLAVFVVNTDCEVASGSSPVPGTDATELERELLLLLTAFPLVGADEITLAAFARAPRDELLDELLLLGK